MNVSLQHNRLCYHEVRSASEMFDIFFGFSQHRQIHPGMHIVLEVCTCNTQNFFANTPLNMPCCAVMQVRDAKVSFVPDKELGMLVHAHNPKTDKGGDNSKERVQSMQSYGMDDWESWKDYIEPHQCLMEHRTGDMYNSQLLCSSGLLPLEAPVMIAEQRTIFFSFLSQVTALGIVNRL